MNATAYRARALRTKSSFFASKAVVIEPSIKRLTASSRSYASGVSDKKQPLDPWNCLTFKASSSKSNGDIDSLLPVSGDENLSGWEISIKDNFCTVDMPTTCASRMLENFTSSFDATVVSLLRGAGAEFVGKTNLDEFAMGSANVHSHFGPVINPEGQDHPGQEPRAAGGSSGGAAASVRAGLCRVAIGSDTGGSVRLPASHCGVWGLKPSYGLISRWGLVSYADSLDTVGIAANTWNDVEQTLKVLSVHDHKDPTSVQIRTRQRAFQASQKVLSRLQQTKGGPLAGLRIGVPKEAFPAELNSQIIPAFESVVQFLCDSGATLVPVSLPHISLALSAYYVITTAEASSNLARFDGVRYGFRHHEKDGSTRTQGAARSRHPYALTRSLGFGREVQKRLLLGAHALSADAFSNTFLRAQSIRKVVQQDFDDVFRIDNVLKNTDETTDSSDTQKNPSDRISVDVDGDGVDIILHPCSVNSAPTLYQAQHESSVEEYVQDLLTVPSSLAGLPAVSMPGGRAEDGWPVGTMAISQWGMEDVLGVVAHAMKDYQPNRPSTK